jgi:hypothetical protein
VSCFTHLPVTLASHPPSRLQFWHDEEERTELASLLALISGGWLVAMGLCNAVPWRNRWDEMAVAKLMMDFVWLRGYSV